MINELAGERVDVAGRPGLRSKPGLVGFAIYGPYETLQPGSYKVEFYIEPIGKSDDKRDALCAFVDVIENLEKTLAWAPVFRSDLKDNKFVLYFDLENASDRMEYRVFINGVEPLLVADRPLVSPAGAEQRPRPRAFPAFMNSNLPRISELFQNGLQVAIQGDDIVVTADAVSFYARTPDDLNFVGEVMLLNTYNVITPWRTCVIDIGMNIGLTSLRLAASPNVQRVHAFEPFPTTYARAADNVRLNPKLQPKIVMNNFGLSDRNQKLTAHVVSDDSGSFSLFESARGEPVAVEIRDAASVLRPLIEAAQAENLQIVAKIDCEGSEYRVFESLQNAGLLGRIAAVMMEYHTGHGPSSQLISALIQSEFVCFDLGVPGKNGFVYAVNTASQHNNHRSQNDGFTRSLARFLRLRGRVARRVFSAVAST